MKDVDQARIAPARSCVLQRWRHHHAVDRPMPSIFANPCPPQSPPGPTRQRSCLCQSRHAGIAPGAARHTLSLPRRQGTAGCATSTRSRASGSWRSRRPTRMSGSARCANGHLQATGLDARGRKQYRYHAEWRALKDESQVRAARGLRPRAAAASARGWRATCARRRGRRWRASWCWPRWCACSTPPSCAWATRSTRAATAPLASPPCATSMPTSAAASLKLRFRGKSGVLHEAQARRSAGGPGGPPLPAVAGTGAVPVPGRGRHAAQHLVDRRQRLPARGCRRQTSPPRISAPGTAPCRRWNSRGWPART